MARPPVFPAEEKVRIVLSILAGEITVAEAARRAKVSEQSVGTWKGQFLEADRAGLTAAGGHLGGGNPAYAVYAARDGKIAVGALESHFRARLFEGLGLPDGADPSAVFGTRTAIEWEEWAASRDLPLAAIKS